MFVKLTNGQPDQFPYTVGQLRRDNPQTSFPKDIPIETLQEYGVFPVVEIVPDFDTKLQYLKWDEVPHKDTNSDNWILGVTVHENPLETLAEAARLRRNELLAETDWMALSDVTMSADMVNYRQALRDITTQAGFPNEVVWPVKPEENV
jgi:hypothetical protein